MWRVLPVERASVRRLRLCQHALSVLLAFSALGCKERFAAEQPFLRESRSAQLAAFEKMEPARQVRVFLATRASGLPDDHLCERLGKTAERTLPEILKAVLEEKEDREKRSLLAALTCVREGAESCDPRVAPIALSLAKSILERDERHEAVASAEALRCR